MISREYPQLGGNYEVIHTQLRASLAGDGKIRPAGEIKEKITYHDPCFLGRRSKVFTSPHS
jgi:Fe-S oxidoreductase